MFFLSILTKYICEGNTKYYIILLSQREKCSVLRSSLRRIRLRGCFIRFDMPARNVDLGWRERKKWRVVILKRTQNCRLYTVQCTVDKKVQLHHRQLHPQATSKENCSLLIFSELL